MRMRTIDAVLLIGLILAATVQVATGQTTDSDRPCRSISCSSSCAFIHALA